MVVHGHLRVAHTQVLAALGDDATIETVQGWINDSKANDDDANRWRRGFEDRLAANPAIDSALSRHDLEALYDRAELTDPERLTMRLHSQSREDGEAKSSVDIARELGIPESTVRDRLERALARLQQLAS